MGVPSTPARPARATRQFSMAFDPVRLREMTPADRAAAVAQLAILLMEAAGVAAGEHDDDKR